MKELHEYEAEIFRRSEKKIRERRRMRMRILSLCIPLCLIAGAWSAASFYRTAHTETADGAANTSTGQERLPELLPEPGHPPDDLAGQEESASVSRPDDLSKQPETGQEEQS